MRFGSKTKLWGIVAFRRKKTQQEECRRYSLGKKQTETDNVTENQRSKYLKTNGRSSRSQTTGLNNKVKGNLRASSENWTILKPKSRK